MYNVPHNIIETGKLFMKVEVKPYKWNRETLLLEMAKYPTKKSFSDNSSSAYSQALRNFPGLVSEHYGSKRAITPLKWTLEKLEAEIVKHSNKYEFREANRSAYFTCVKYHPYLLDQYLKRKKHTPPKWTESALRIELAKYESRKEFKNKSTGYTSCTRYYPELLNEFYKEPWATWTYTEILKEIAKYKTINQFCKGNQAAYVAAKKRFPKLIEKHLQRINHKKWTLEELKIEIGKYQTRVEFATYSGGAYAVAKKMCPDYLDSVYGRLYGYGTRDVIYLWNIIGTDIYKIGLTSSHKGEFRIKEVSKNIPHDGIEIIRLVKAKKPQALESELLKIGKKPDFNEKFDGCTEFRRFTTQELRLAINIIDSAIIDEDKDAA